MIEKMNIDIGRIKAFNEKLKQENQKNASLQAELNFLDAEIAKGCAAISQELGISVTPETIEAVMAEQERIILADLEAGEAILERIRLEEQGLTATNLPGNAGGVVTQQPYVAPVQQEVQQVQQAVPVQAQPMQTMQPMQAMPIATPEPVAHSEFAGMAVPQPVQAQPVVAEQNNVPDAGNAGQLPPLFQSTNGIMGI